jgi:hypothetical protein
MKDTSPISDDQLLDYFDGNLSPADAEKVTVAIAQNMNVRKRFDELKSLHEYLKAARFEEPSRNFTHAVMGRLDQYPLQKGQSILNSILLLAGVLIALAIAALLVSRGFFDGTATLNLNTVNLTPKFQTQELPSIMIDGKLMVNIIIMLTLAIAFVVLDRAILKPYFRNRLQSTH